MNYPLDKIPRNFRDGMLGLIVEKELNDYIELKYREILNQKKLNQLKNEVSFNDSTSFNFQNYGFFSNRFDSFCQSDLTAPIKENNCNKSYNNEDVPINKTKCRYSSGWSY